MAFGRGGTLVTTSGDYPAYDLLRLDLSGGRVDTTHKPPKGFREGGTDGPSVRRFEVTGHPVQIENAAVSLDLSATDVRFRYRRGDDERLMLAPAGCGDGEVVVEIKRADLEALIMTAAKRAAAAQGAQVTKLQLDLKLLGPRSLAVEALVSAKKMFLTGSVRLSGRVDVDEGLNARVSGLDCVGEGVVGSVAAGALKPKLRQADGKTIALGSFAFEGMRPRDVRIESADPVRVVASFGNTAA
jgi:hypothetical protein